MRSFTRSAAKNNAECFDVVSDITGDSLATQNALTPEQKKLLIEVLPLYRQLLDQRPDEETSRARLAAAAYRVGRIEDRLGRTDQALAAFRVATDQYAALVADSPAAPDFRRNLATSHHSLGVVFKGQGKAAEAEAEYLTALRLRTELAAAHPAVADYRRELATTHYLLGNLFRERRQTPAAEDHLRSALALQVAVFADGPAVPAHRVELARIRHTLGVLLAESNRPAEGAEQLRAALRLQQPSADAADGPERRRELAVTHNSLGNLLKDADKLADAREQYDAALALQSKLVLDFPSAPAYRQELARTHNNLGIVFKRLNQQPAAEAEYLKALAVREKLAADFPATPAYRIDLGSSQYNFGLMESAAGRPGQSLHWFDLAITTLSAVHDRWPTDPTARRVLRNSHEARAATCDRLKRYADAVKDWDRAIELSRKEEQAGLRASRAASTVKAEQVGEAVAEVAELRTLSGWDADQLFDLGRVYSVASAQVADKKREYADAAMELLTKAVKAGYADAAHMKKDPDLDPLRERDDFKTLLADLEAKFPPKKETLPPPRADE
jgi:tetratricopeptide (TPR) repeat protein